MSFLFFGFRHWTKSVKTKRGVAIMAKNSITRRISEALKFNVEPSRFLYIFVFSVYMVYREKFKWMWATDLPIVVTRAEQSTIGNHGRKSKTSISFSLRLSNSFVVCWVKEHFNSPLASSVPIIMWIFFEKFFSVFLFCLCNTANTRTIFRVFPFRLERISTSRADMFWHKNMIPRVLA